MEENKLKIRAVSDSDSVNEGTDHRKRGVLLWEVSKSNKDALIHEKRKEEKGIFHKDSADKRARGIMLWDEKPEDSSSHHHHHHSSRHHRSEAGGSIAMDQSKSENTGSNRLPSVKRANADNKAEASREHHERDIKEAPSESIIARTWSEEKGESSHHSSHHHHSSHSESSHSSSFVPHAEAKLRENAPERKPHKPQVDKNGLSKDTRARGVMLWDEEVQKAAKSKHHHSKKKAEPKKVTLGSILKSIIYDDDSVSDDPTRGADAEDAVISKRGALPTAVKSDISENIAHREHHHGEHHHEHQSEHRSNNDSAIDHKSAPKPSPVKTEIKSEPKPEANIGQSREEKPSNNPEAGSAGTVPDEKAEKLRELYSSEKKEAPENKKRRSFGEVMKNIMFVEEEETEAEKEVNAEKKA